MPRASGVDLFARNDADTITTFHRLENELGCRLLLCMISQRYGGSSFGSYVSHFTYFFFFVFSSFFFTLRQTDQLSRQSTVSWSLVHVHFSEPLRKLNETENSNENVPRSAVHLNILLVVPGPGNDLNIPSN